MTTITTQKAILSTILMDPVKIHHVTDLVRPAMFHADLRKLAQDIWSQHREGQTISIPLLIDAGHSGLYEMAGEYAVGSSELPDLARQLNQDWNNAEHLRLMQEAFQQMADGVDPSDVFLQMVKDRESLLDYSEVTDTRMADGQAFMEWLTNRPMGIPSGWTALDNFTGGWQPGNLIYLAGRPGMGKTEIALQFAWSAAATGKPTLFVSFEMGKVECQVRLYGRKLNWSNKKIQDAHLPPPQGLIPEELIQVEQVVSDHADSVHLHLWDNVSNKIEVLLDKIRAAIVKLDIGLVVIDYLQLMQTVQKTNSRNYEIEEISRSLKRFALHHRLPVICLSQLSRQVENRGGSKRPQLSDLRDSGSIEQDADIVAFVYRPEYYGFLEDEEGNSLVGVVELIIAKHRQLGANLPKTFQTNWNDRMGVGLPELVASNGMPF